MSWTDERVELLKKLWKQGKSAAEIAKALGGEITRNAVIGKAHRLKLSNKTGATPPQKPVKEPVARQKAPRKGVKLIDLKDRMCRWPVGDPRSESFHFCGDPAISGLPYCAEHARAAYQVGTRNRSKPGKDDADSQARGTSRKVASSG